MARRDRLRRELVRQDGNVDGLLNFEYLAAAGHSDLGVGFPLEAMGVYGRALLQLAAYWRGQTGWCDGRTRRRET